MTNHSTGPHSALPARLSFPHDRRGHEFVRRERQAKSDKIAENIQLKETENARSKWEAENA